MDKIKELGERYGRRIGNEVGWLAELVRNGEKFFTSTVNKDYINIAKQLNNDALSAVSRMQITYIVNLFEFFMKDFICIKELFDEEEGDEDNFFSEFRNKNLNDWTSYYSNLNFPVNNSTSFMNMRYSFFILEKKYGIKAPVDKYPYLLELGSLRNCIVHHEGNLEKCDKGKALFKNTLQETLRFIEHPGDQQFISDLNKNDYLKKVIYNIQQFYYSFIGE